MMRRVMGLVAALSPLAALPARADYHVFSPYEIDYGELEIEHNGDAAFDRRPDQTGAASYTSEWGTGLTPWWHSEVEFGFDRDPGTGQPTQLTQLVTENMFQLTEPGEAFLDSGFYIEYGQSMARGVADEVTFGPALAKDIGRTVNTLDVFLTREFGPNKTTNGFDLSYIWQTKWTVWGPLSPAIEIYGDAGTLGKMPAFSQQQFLVGPVGIGLLRLNEIGLGRAGNFKYELGWLFGATSASAAGMLRWRVELEIPF